MNTATLSNSPILLPALPYEENALQPVISANTLSFHHGKHHKTYVDTLNKLIAGTEFSDLPLEKIVKATSGRSGSEAIFNNSAQAWNHAFYWRKPQAQGRRRAAGRSQGPDRIVFRQRRRMQEGMGERGGRAIRQRAGHGWFRTARNSRSSRRAMPIRRSSRRRDRC